MNEPNPGIPRNQFRQQRWTGVFVARGNFSTNFWCQLGLDQAQHPCHIIPVPPTPWPLRFSFRAQMGSGRTKKHLMHALGTLATRAYSSPPLPTCSAYVFTYLLICSRSKGGSAPVRSSCPLDQGILLPVHSSIPSSWRRSTLQLIAKPGLLQEKLHRCQPLAGK